MEPDKINSSKDKMILWYFVIFFLIVAIVNGIFVTIAASTHTGVITENAYQKGLNYNAVIEESEKQDRLGWTSSIELKDNLLNVWLYDKNGDDIKNAEVTVYFTRPSQEGHDFSVSLGMDSKNIYSKEVNFPLKGLWDVRVLAKWNQQQYQKSKQIVVK